MTTDVKTPEKKEVVHQQLNLLTDLEDQTLQTRFERFCEKAVDVLTSKRMIDGEPVFVAGKAKATLAIKVHVERLQDDTLTFVFDHEVKESFPSAPGRHKTSPFIRNVGLSQSLTHQQLSLLDPLHAQPQAATKEEAETALSE